MKLFLNILLITVSVFACYVEDIYLLLAPVQPDQVVSMTLRSYHSFDFDQEKELKEKRDRAIEEYVPLFTYLSRNVESSKSKMVDLIMKVHLFQTSKKMAVKDFIDYVGKEFGIEMEAETAHRMLQHGELIKVLSGVLTIQESVLNQKILDDLTLIKGKKIVEILSPDPAGIVAYAAVDIMSLDAARNLLEDRTSKLLWKESPPVLAFALKVTEASLTANLSYDREENDRRIERIIRKYPSTTISYQPMDILIPFGKKILPEDLLLISAYQEVRRDHFSETVSWLIFSIMMIVIYFNLFYKRKLFKKDSHFIFLISIMIVFILSLKLMLLFSSLSVYVLPFAILPLLFILLNYGRIPTLGITLVTAAFVTMFTGQTLYIYLFYTLGSLSAILFSNKIRKRFQVIYPSLLIGSINALYVALPHIDAGWMLKVSSIGGLIHGFFPPLSVFMEKMHLFSIGEAFLGGFIIGPLALVLLPVLEIRIHLASTFKLNRLSDLNHPLLKTLAAKSPGTYQHTMMVAQLVHAAGDAIGADTLLLRVGAYYHDLGKALNADFFTENQFSGKNSHDVLDPRESASIIINHVVKGKRIAEGNGIPDSIIDLICQHHGTQKVEYFYNKALKMLPKEEVRAEDFRYCGPKPQSIEAAILMVADTLEAAARTLEKPTRDALQDLVTRIIHTKMMDGQFDECQLTTSQIATLTRSFTRTLEASLHSRIKYPWQEEKGKKDGWGRKKKKTE